MLVTDMIMLYTAILPSNILQTEASSTLSVPSKHEVSVKLGISGVEDQAAALHTLTETVLLCLDCMLRLTLGQRGPLTSTDSIEVLFEVLKKAAGRTLVYEDDKWQASMEPALIGKLALLLHFSLSPSQVGDGSIGKILCDAVDAMCVQAGLRASVPSSCSSSTKASSSTICYVYAREQILSLSETIIPGSDGNSLLRELNSSLPLSLGELGGDRMKVALKVKALFVQIIEKAVM